MADSAKRARFEQTVMQHFDAAYNLARWMARSPSDAEDIVQDAFLRAFQAFDSHRGTNARAWLFTIVRNCCYTWLKKNRRWVEFEDAISEEPDPEEIQLMRVDAALLEEGLLKLPPVFREVLLLREIEDLSYREIAEVTGAGIGTVMSRLSRARRQLHNNLVGPPKKESTQ